jgi:hypothetical protein
MNESWRCVINQLTIRGFGDELKKRLVRLARTRRISLNKAALLLLRRGAGLTEGGGGPQVVGSSLDNLIGTWTEADEAEFLEAIKPCEAIDEELWR